MPSACARKTAICARVSDASGQKLPLPQPAVTPLSFSASTNLKNGLAVGTSLKVAVAGPGATCRFQNAAQPAKLTLGVRSTAM